MFEERRRSPGRLRSAEHPIGVVLVDSLPGALAQMAGLVDSNPDMETLIHAQSADEALASMQDLPHRLGVVVVVAMPLPGEHDTFWFIRAVREQYPTLPILTCGTDIDEATISWALFTGADGFVSLDVKPDQVVAALRRISGRELILEGLPAGWMEHGLEETPAPVVVLPTTATENEQSHPGEDGKELTLLLPEERVAVLGEESIWDAPAARESLGASTGPSIHRPAGSRIGRLFGKRRRSDAPEAKATAGERNEEQAGETDQQAGE